MKKRSFTLPHLIAQLWGTTTFSDCLAGAGFCLSSDRLIHGSSIAEYEAEFAEQAGVKYAVSFSTGRGAFFALLQIFGISNGDEVLIQAPTHIVIPNAIRHAGGIPVFVDCDLNTFNMDFKDAARKITSRTKMLLVQHTFGVPVDLQAATKLVEEHHLILVEDCVHALGAEYHGRRIGSFGHAAFFSTEETKIISTTMGGMAVTNDPLTAQRLREIQQSCIWPEASVVRRYLLKLMAYHFATQSYIHPYTRWVYLHLLKNSVTNMAPGTTTEEERKGGPPEVYYERLSNGQAAIALRQLRRLQKNLGHRRAIAQDYRRQLQEKKAVDIKLDGEVQPSYVRYPLMVADRETAKKAAASRVILGEWFSSVLEESDSPEFGTYQPGSCPNAEFASSHLVNLPTHFRASHKDAEQIINILEPFLIAASDIQQK